MARNRQPRWPDFGPKRPPKAWFVTRHPGAIEWARRQGIEAEAVSHVDDVLLKEMTHGDQVIGVLPVTLAARVCETGAIFQALDMTVPAEMRGKELSADDMDRAGAKLVHCNVSIL